MVATSRWPKIPNFVYASAAALPAPALSNLDWRDTILADRAQRRAWRDAQWSRQVTLVLDTPALPVPAASVFKLPESVRVTMLYSPPSTRRAERTAETARVAEARGRPGALRAGKSRRQIRAAAMRKPASARQVAHHLPQATGAANQAAQVRPVRKNARAVRVAGLKKR
jgi:hypothetical protein